ncbi:Cytochrome P450, E-class, group IV [Trema orientale]|uniref:Cytochrome P450, E-class, group IV n=1 Tax=Trema orientale TaxID=63057 RepID=A0A2P5CG74_TREOI|nr:Cytochrome P450, E-class, group IV [Trema orientale]
MSALFFAFAIFFILLGMFTANPLVLALVGILVSFVAFILAAFLYAYVKESMSTSASSCTYRLIAPSHSEVYTVDPANIEHILKTNFLNYEKSTERNGSTNASLLVMNFQQEFSETSVLKVFWVNAAKLASKISVASVAEKLIDLQDMLMKSTLGSMFKVGFGVDLNNLNGLDEFGNQFTKVFDDSSVIVFWPYVDLTWRIKSLSKKNLKIINDFIFELIRRKREQMRSGKLDSGKDDILLRFLMESENDPKNMNDQHRHNSQLHDCWQGLFCQHSHLVLLLELIAEEALDKMQYLHAAITETLQLYPAVPLVIPIPDLILIHIVNLHNHDYYDGKSSAEDDVSQMAFQVKNGDDVTYVAYAMGRMTKIRGENAEEFRLERWLDGGGLFRSESPFKFTAFHAGPQICLGKEFAYRQNENHGRCSIVKSYGIIPENKRRYHPVAGTILNQLINFRRLHHYMTELARKHTTYRLLGLFRSEIYTSDPANVEYILKTNFSNYGKGWYHYNILSDLLGDGFFTVDGEKWLHQRKVSSYQFSTRVLRDFSGSVFKTNAVKLARIVSEAAASNQVIDIQDLLMKSTLETVFKIILGLEMDSMCGTDEEATRFSNAFDEASAITLYRYVDAFWKIKRFLNIGSEAVLRKNIRLVDEFVYKVIKTKIEGLHTSQNDDLPIKKGDIVTRLIELGEKDTKDLKDMVLSFIIAGKDTTATTLSWFLYMLCKHPSIQEKVAQEVREATKLKEDSSVEELAASLTEEALDKMQYLLAALTETLRLYPAVPVDWKLCFSDDTLPDGFSVRKWDTVSYQPYAMGRMESLWGDNAEEFRPERWLDENGLFRPESPFKFTAFQAGPRICLGKEFAYRQMKVFSAVLVGRYRFKLSDEGKQVTYRTMLNLHVDGGLHLQAYKRLGD